MGFEKLPEEDQRAMLRKLQDRQVDVMTDMARAIGKSQVAENDLHVHNLNVARLDHDRKIYSSKASVETGSGTIDIQIRGGDTRFIVPILVVIGVILLSAIAIFALR